MTLGKAMVAAIVWAALATGAAYAAPADERSDAAIRAGKNIATASCISCHVVSKGQQIAPLGGTGAPSFFDIAERPNIDASSLVDFMKTARWKNDALPHTLLPMSNISDDEKVEIAAYILSLRHGQ